MSLTGLLYHGRRQTVKAFSNYETIQVLRVIVVDTAVVANRALWFCKLIVLFGWREAEKNCGNETDLGGFPFCFNHLVVSHVTLNTNYFTSLGLRS